MARKPRASVPSSAASIRILRERGMSDVAIGRAIGRNDRLIGQIAPRKEGVKGKPGENLQTALSALVQGRRVTAPKRRTKKSGELANVRASRYVNPKKSAKEWLRQLELMNERKQNVSIAAKWGSIENVTSGNINLTSGYMRLFESRDGSGTNSGQLARRLAAFMKRHSNLSDEEQAIAFMKSEFQRRETPKGKRFRYDPKSTKFTDLEKVTFTKHVRKRAYHKHATRKAA